MPPLLCDLRARRCREEEELEEALLGTVAELGPGSCPSYCGGGVKSVKKKKNMFKDFFY